MCGKAFDATELWPANKELGLAKVLQEMGSQKTLSNNPAGAITGWEIDANNVYHGFLRTYEDDGVR
jgi:hypothetical protein